MSEQTEEKTSSEQRGATASVYIHQSRYIPPGVIYAGRREIMRFPHGNMCGTPENMGGKFWKL